MKIGGLSPAFKMLFVFALSCTAMLAWEVFEFAGDKLWSTNVQQSVHETMMDLILGVSGSLLLLVLRFMLRK
jgi:hypothetical protein